MVKDYYAILGLPDTATAVEVKKAYRRLARKHHPDRNAGDKGAEARFKEVGEANEVLSDPEKRARYDAERGSAQAHSGPPPKSGSRARPFASPAPGSPGPADDLSDLFRSLFGAEAAGPADFPRAARAGDRRPPPLEALAELTLEEAFAGTVRLVELSGRRIEAAIPAGVDSGSKVRLAGCAPDGRDLLIEVLVSPHPVFTRQGDDIERELAVRLGEALLGAEVPVAGLAGSVMLVLPPATRNGQVFRLAGQGMPRLWGVGRGDLRVRVRVVLPERLTPAARAAAERFCRLAAQPDPRA